MSKSPPNENTAIEHSNNFSKQSFNNLKKKNNYQNVRNPTIFRRQEGRGSSFPSNNSSSSVYSHYFSNDSVLVEEQNKKNIRRFLINTLHKNVKDRKILLETEEKLSNFINCDDKTLKFDPMTSYDRMLIHRTASFFNLDHNVDQTGKCVVITKNEKSKCPDESLSSLIRNDNYSDSRNRYRSRRGASTPSFYYHGNVQDYQYRTSLSSPTDFDPNNQQQFEIRSYTYGGFKGRQSGQGFYHDSGMSDLTTDTISPRYESPLDYYGASQSPVHGSGYMINPDIPPPNENAQVTEDVNKISETLSQKMDINNDNVEGSIVSATSPPQPAQNIGYYYPSHNYPRNYYHSSYSPYDTGVNYQQQWNPFQQQHFISQQYIPGRVVYYHPSYYSPPAHENNIYPMIPSSPGIIYSQPGPLSPYYHQEPVLETEEHNVENTTTQQQTNYDNNSENIESALQQTSNPPSPQIEENTSRKTETNIDIK
uniref:R3H domain-containing protein n=1 Tax=Parastrongyloides trichosuri TaxID=131310 RepID=A0A0N4ZNQ4_PARTI